MIYDVLYTAQRVVELLILLMLPAAVAYGGERLLHSIDTIGYHEVPGLARMSSLSGLVAGWLLLYFNFSGSLWEFDTLFARGGPWDVPFLDLFTLWLNPANLSVRPALDHLTIFDLDDNLFLTALVSIGLWAVAMIGAVRYFGLRAPLAWLSNALVWLWGVGLVFYVAMASSWALCMMNFWAVVLWFFTYRRWRFGGH